jgi:UDP-glucuronate 4-epimerase
MKFLITGSAGFIGFALARRLLEEGFSVTGFDAMTPYYDVTLKQARHAELKRFPAFRERIGFLEDADALRRAAEDRPDVVLHFAAQAGVRYSLENPRAYADANLTGTFNMLELAREIAPQHMLFASTSSVYGSNDRMPFVETARADHPLTLYSATKKAGEDMAHAYAHLWRLPTTVFRFFTVYGPWGRPDMALFKFVKATLADEPIDIYGYGRMKRDFTYVDDLIEAVRRLIDRPPSQGDPIGPHDSLAPAAPYRVVNIGGGEPVGLLDFVSAVEKALGRPARRNLTPMQKGDVPETFADPALLEALTGYKPATPVDEGVRRFVAWYREFYRV